MCSALTSDVNVTISFHKDSQDNPIRSVLSPTRSESIPIPLELRVQGSNLTREGIFILATKPITVMGLSSGIYTAASFLALPIDALGVEYYVVTWERDMSSIEFLIIGVYNNTDVQLTLPTSISLNGYFAERGNPFTETINRLDTLQIQAMEDLSGTRIEANKKIAVISGNAKAVVSPTPRNYSDHAIEMLPSVDKWGKHFIVTSTPLRRLHDYMKLVSEFHNTNVSMNCGSIKSFTLEEANKIHNEALYSGSSCEIISDQPILVVLFTNNQINQSDKSDPSMVLIPPVEQWGNAFTFSVDAIFENYLILIVRDKDRYELLLNGTTVNFHSFKQIQGTDFYSGFQRISKGVHSLTHQSGNASFSALLYGKKNQVAYYVPVGMNLNSLYQVSINQWSKQSTLEYI
ncbi:hypothetical protein FSP39_024626 [Pinctada imbricata]|uniref:IgGFc-binding protein N-terminal domain-containing protein n=1 Tax=Pinctada imbricata TaxID=66713 RepID=A0AA89C9E7_PINIB|nr:hypothetical protein FSP39_024626 [Pinctada imbricata]